MERLSCFVFGHYCLVARWKVNLDEEIQFHLEREADKQRDSGLAEAEAGLKARQLFGRVTSHKDAARYSWGVRLWDELVVDVRYGVRQLLARKSFTAVAVLTLGLGVGGTAALFGVAYSLLVRPMPFEKAEQLRVFWDDYSWSGEEFSLARETSKAYSGLAAFTVDDQTLRLDDRSSILVTSLISGEAFDVLGRLAQNRSQLHASGGAPGNRTRGDPRPRVLAARTRFG